ncbi:MAG: winged helix DNA-binding domain-containing protein [Chloroflexota bacterium]
MLPHLLRYASLQGMLCQSPHRWVEPTYVHLDDRLRADSPSSPPNRAEGLAWLARRYLAGYGPADMDDFAWWSGLPMADARSTWGLLQAEIVTINVAGKHWALFAEEYDRLQTVSAPASPPSARLLSGFDSYVLGYKDRHLTVNPTYLKRVNAGGGMLKPTVLVDGRVVGVWNRTIDRRRLNVTVTPFARLASTAKRTP